MTKNQGFTERLSADLTITYEIPEPHTRREELANDSYLADIWKDAPEYRKEKQFPSKLHSVDIEAWRRAIFFTLKLDDKVIARTEKSQVRHMSYADMQQIMADHNIISSVSTYKIRIANLSEIEHPKYPFKKYPWKKWYVFVDSSNVDKTERETVVVAIPDVENENLYDFPGSNYRTYRQVLELAHYEQNKILDKFRDKLANPAADAIKKARADTDLSQDEFAKRAGISKTTLATAETGGNVSVEVLMKIAMAAGKFLSINFE